MHEWRLQGNKEVMKSKQQYLQCYMKPNYSNMQLFNWKDSLENCKSVNWKDLSIFRLTAYRSPWFVVKEYLHESWKHLLGCVGNELNFFRLDHYMWPKGPRMVWSGFSIVALSCGRQCFPYHSLSCISFITCIQECLIWWLLLNSWFTGTQETYVPSETTSEAAHLLP